MMQSLAEALKSACAEDGAFYMQVGGRTSADAGVTNVAVSTLGVLINPIINKIHSGSYVGNPSIKIAEFISFHTRKWTDKLAAWVNIAFC